MTHPNDEVRRIHEGASGGEVPSGLGTVRFVIACPSGSVDVLRRARAVMVIVASHHSQWPDVQSWGSLVPRWFVDECPPERSSEDLEEYLRSWRALSNEEQALEDEYVPWSFPDWLYWMEPGRRRWRWWDAQSIPDLGQVVLTVEVEEWPFPWGAIRWLFRASGASTVKAETELTGI